jgi:DNA-binding SARP family transcriptional activator
MRLCVLGGLSLERTHCDSVPFAGAATQRKPLALLAVLAAAGRQGPEDARAGVAVSRERLTALLWPEADEARGRQTLKQTLSSLRRDLRTDPFLGSADVRLDPSRLACDLWDFEDALSRGEPARAVVLYRGPFLHGIHIRGAAGFEDWADAERARLARRYVGALETLAGGAERRATSQRRWNGGGGWPPPTRSASARPWR